MSSTLSRPPQMDSSIRRVAILFAGGPAPAANAVISTAAVSFLRNNIEVIGVFEWLLAPGGVRPRSPLAGGPRLYQDHAQKRLTEPQQPGRPSSALPGPTRARWSPAPITSRIRSGSRR